MSSSLFQAASDFNPVIVMESYSESNIVTLHQGDSKTFLKTIPDGAISLVVTSPPYNIGKSYERKQVITAYLAEQEIIISELVRILDNQGSICWQTGNYIDEGEVFPLDVYYYHIFKKHGFKLRNRIIPVLILGIDTDRVKPKDLKLAEATQKYLFSEESFLA